MPKKGNKRKRTWKGRKRSNAGRTFLLVALWVLAFPVMLIVTLVKAAAKAGKSNDFRKFHDAETRGHPQFVYGHNRKEYKTVGITHSEATDNVRNVPMVRNPEPGNNEPAYMLPRPNRIPKGTRNKKLKNWKLAKEDRKKAKKFRAENLAQNEKNKKSKRLGDR